MARKTKQEIKPLQPPTKSRQRKAPAQPVSITPRTQRKRKSKVGKMDELMLWSKALDYLGNFLLLIFVSTII
ncbi:MAG: hypothetical protein RL122_751, partial [Pseudomonadota bacterium]